MKISRRNYPILEMVETKTLLDLLMIPDDKYTEQDDPYSLLESSFVNMLSSIKSNIKYISAPFYEAMVKSMNSLMVDGIWNNIEAQSGILLLPDKRVIVYDISGKVNKDCHEGIVIYIKEDKFIGVRYQTLEENGFKSILTNTILDNTNNALQRKHNIHLSYPELLDQTDSILYTELICLLNFIKYAKVETKLLPANKVIKDINCKYVNTTNLDIQHYDSTWFTNLIKSDSFNVRGHFRLQPIGEGRQDKKLIWISEFQKEGYTAPAKKLKDTNQDDVCMVITTMAQLKPTKFKKI